MAIGCFGKRQKKYQLVLMACIETPRHGKKQLVQWHNDTAYQTKVGGDVIVWVVKGGWMADRILYNLVIVSVETAVIIVCDWLAWFCLGGQH